MPYIQCHIYAYACNYIICVYIVNTLYMIYMYNYNQGSENFNVYEYTHIKILNPLAKIF